MQGIWLAMELVIFFFINSHRIYTGLLLLKIPDAWNSWWLNVKWIYFWQWHFIHLKSNGFTGAAQLHERHIFKIRHSQDFIHRLHSVQCKFIIYLLYRKECIVSEKTAHFQGISLSSLECYVCTEPVICNL